MNRIEDLHKVLKNWSNLLAWLMAGQATFYYLYTIN
jgi:hypothetical protein